MELNDTEFDAICDAATDIVLKGVLKYHEDVLMQEEVR